MPFKKGLIGYWAGKKRPDISAMRKGKKLSEEHKRKLSKSHKGKKLSEEHKRKIVENLTGRPVSKETREKIGNANRGIKSGSWKGNNATYRSVHCWVVNNWGKDGECESCGSKEYLDWHNIDCKYSRERKDWMRLCRKCHMTLDGRIKK